MTDGDDRSLVIWLVIGAVIGIGVWVIHSHIPSATDAIKQIKVPSLLDMLQGIKP